MRASAGFSCDLVEFREASVVSTNSRVSFLQTIVLAYKRMPVFRAASYKFLLVSLAGLALLFAAPVRLFVCPSVMCSHVLLAAVLFDA